MGLGDSFGAGARAAAEKEGWVFGADGGAGAGECFCGEMPGEAALVVDWRGGWLAMGLEAGGWVKEVGGEGCLVGEGAVGGMGE